MFNIRIYYRRNVSNLIIILFLLVAVFSCKNDSPYSEYETTIRTEDGNSKIYRGNKPYFIKGAGGQIYLEKLAEYGGNSIRLWSSNEEQKEAGKTVEQILDEADSLGLTVTLGLWVTHPRHNAKFYDDSAKINAQLEKFRKDVQRYRNHPALLMWAVGNEVHLHSEDVRVWDAVADITKMIKEEDSNHIVSTIIAGINESAISNIIKKVPELDLLGVNIYNDDFSFVPEKIRESGWEKPYFIGEFGPRGPWMVAKTAWDVRIEPIPEKKISAYIGGYQTFEQDQQLCVGSYAFKWGWKWEKTYSWFNLFTDDGKEIVTLDAMEYLWKGSWPENRSPVGGEILLEGVKAENFKTLSAGQSYEASVSADDPESDKITYDWFLYPEGTSNARGGDPEDPKSPLDVVIENNSQNSVKIHMPDKEGAYRIYALISDQNNRISISNYPIYLK